MATETRISRDAPERAARSASPGGALARGLSALRPGTFRRLESELAERLAQAPLVRNQFGFDRYGFDVRAAPRMLLPAAWLYHYWFRVETFDIERVPGGRVLLIANHAGQFGYDGAMLSMAMLFAAAPPRLARGMGEYFMWRVPWMGVMASRIGATVGTPENCIALLESDECVMVFPEGARGANKPFRKRYQLQRFGQGFMRLALRTGTPIVPVGIVGSEEQQPGFANLSDLGRRFDLPSLPITISQPWFGPLGSAFALPVKYRMYFGEPLRFEGDADEDDAAIEQRIDQVKETMRGLLARGRRERRGIFT
jgi:1-acyl-sn-glycerol-3-phosphate acyltransferase